MRFILTLLIYSSLVVSAQDYSTFQKTYSKFVEASKIIDANQRKEAFDKTFNELKETKHIPLISEDSVLFLFQGEANSLQWMGDFNGWGYDKKFNSTGKRFTGSDIWYLKSSFPKNARLDYKILVNSTQWLIDPDNENQQWSGVGVNSELRMPAWKEDDVLTVSDNVPHGKLDDDLLFKSKVLGYQITYSVYLPANYNQLGKLPVIYVTDGYEYIHPKMGNMITVLDNLIGSKKNQTGYCRIH